MKGIILLLVFISFHSFAEFKENEWSNDMSDTKVIERYSTGNYIGEKFGFRCDIEKDHEKDFMLTFASKDSIATPNSSVDVKLRVDQGKVHELNGRLYNNSYKSGIVKNVTNDLLDDLRNGTEVIIHVYSYRKLAFQAKFSLKGSANALNETAGKCGINSQLNNDQVNKIKLLELERDKKIADIQNEYQQLISAVKNSK